MDHSKKSTYLFSIDALRVISILAVILIHSSIKVLANLDHNLSIGFIPFVLNQISRFAVPLFFLISGFVLELNYKDKISYLNFFKKRALRVVVPFVFWSFLYIVIFNGFSFINELDFDFFYEFINGNASYHLYFVPSLIIFYMLFPLLHKYLRIIRNQYILFLLFIIQSYFLYQDFYNKNLVINDNLRIVVLSYFMFVAGMVASLFKEKILIFAKDKIPFLISLLIIVATVMVFHVLNISIANNTAKFIYNQHHPINYLYTFSFALLFYYLFEISQFGRQKFIFLSKLSFFVFFIHVIIQHFIWEFAVTSLINSFGYKILGSIWLTPLLFFAVATASFLIAYFIHKIPGASKITG